MAKVAIAKRRAKRLAAASVTHSPELKSWLQCLYSVVNDTAVPFGMQMYATEVEAIGSANETLKTADADWVEVPDADVEQYITERTRNKWTVADRSSGR